MVRFSTTTKIGPHWPPLLRAPVVVTVSTACYLTGMQTALRKMGNSTGLVLPRPILKALGVTNGAAMQLVVEKGRVIATPIRRKVREGWEEDAQRIGGEPSTDDDQAWRSFGNEADDALRW
jgi:antitoxin MazE